MKEDPLRKLFRESTFARPKRSNDGLQRLTLNVRKVNKDFAVANHLNISAFLDGVLDVVRTGAVLDTKGEGGLRKPVATRLVKQQRLEAPQKPKEPPQTPDGILKRHNVRDAEELVTALRKQYRQRVDDPGVAPHSMAAWLEDKMAKLAVLGLTFTDMREFEEYLSKDWEHEDMSDDNL